MQKYTNMAALSTSLNTTFLTAEKDANPPSPNPKGPFHRPCCHRDPPNPLVLSHKRAELYRLCGGKFQSWNADFLASEKDAGLTGGSLSRQRAKYYYKGYPDNYVTAKVAAHQLIRNGVFASFVRSNKGWLQFTKPGNHKSYQVEWETVENTKVHYENVERHMLAVGIA